MIPATTSVSAYSSKTGEQLVYNQWVPVSVNINSPDDESEAQYTPTSASVTLRRCYTAEGGKTERLPDHTARLLKISRDTSTHIPNIYAPATDTGPAFVAKPYPEGASPLVKAQIDVENEQAKARYDQERSVYPKAVRDYILASVMAPIVTAATMMGTAQGKL